MDGAAAEDVLLLQRAGKGDRGAIAALYDRHIGRMLNVARRVLGDEGAAEDLAHDTFLEAWRRASSYDPNRGSVRTWLMVRLRSRALDRIRRAKVRAVVAGEPGDQTPGESGVTMQLAPDRARVRTALEALPDAQREVLELGYFYGLSSTEIAAKTGTPVGTVKSRTAAGMAKLRAAFKGEGGR